MRLTALLAAAAALSLAAAPAFARPANPAAKLSLTSAGDASGGAPAKHAKGSTSTIMLAGAAVVAVVAAAVGMSHHDSKAASA
jgi:hypothetical protein